MHGDGTVGEYLNALKSSRCFGPQVIHHEELQAQAARFGRLVFNLPPELVVALGALGVDRLYLHQVRAIDLIRQRKNVIVATPTASGKTFIYNLPVVAEIISNPAARALYLFPLKALAQDQLRAINELVFKLPENLQLRAAIYDGDTSAYQRRKLRENPPQVLISNPDMLHLAMLRHHEKWADLFSNLSHVILDEAHTYRGIFGSHMAMVVRRLLRLCRFYGSKPVFILSSATIGNPAELAADLLGMPAEVVGDSGAPRAKRHFLFINPQNSAVYTAGQLLEAAIKRGLRTIVYTQSRKVTELLYMWTSKRLGVLATKLSSYRAGFLPEERRQIESKLADGSLLGVISTSALELGIDIGGLDICLLVGYLGTIMSTWQRSGRVGRQMRESLIVLVGQEDALDQYVMRHAADFFSRQVEAAVLNPANRIIMRQHLDCAVAEQPLAIDETFLDDRITRAVLTEMAAETAVFLDVEGRYYHAGRKHPHREVNLRGNGQSCIIHRVDDDTVLGEIAADRCLKECHPGAVYLHRGITWLVTDLDLVERRIAVRRSNPPYFTKTLGEKTTEILSTTQVFQGCVLRVCFGNLRVTEKITAFQRRAVGSHKLLASIPLDLPPLVFETEGLWLEIPAEFQRKTEENGLHFMGGIHAMEHGIIGIFPLLVLCDRNDIGGIAYVYHEQLEGAAIFIYDGHPGGVGLTRKAFDNIEALLQLSLRIISSCSCELGCPSCIHSPKCGSGNRPLDKAAALFLLEQVIAGHGEKHGGTEGLKKISGAGEQGSSKTVCQRKGVKTVNYGVFDLETKRSAAEVGGWHRAERMGVSVAVLYDSGREEYVIYLERDIPELIKRLQSFDLVVGFNIKSFDYRVLSAYTSFDLGTLPTLDILTEVFTRLGYRLSLDRLAEQTLGVHKSADGLQALQWYKEGRIDKITHYCRDDVAITRNLFLYGRQYRYLVFANKAGTRLRLPVSFDNFGTAQETGETG